LLAPPWSDEFGPSLVFHPQPGYHAISVTLLTGHMFEERFRNYYSSFWNLKPIARAGYSMYLYKVEPPQTGPVWPIMNGGKVDNGGMRWLRFIVIGLALMAAAPRLAAQFQLRFDPEQNLWSIENSVAGAVFQLTPEGTFELRRLTNKTSNDVWTPPPGVRCSPIRIRLEDAVFDENTAVPVGPPVVGRLSRRSYRHVIELADLGGIGRILVELEMYEKQPVLRYRVRFQNLRQQTVRLLAADMLAWSFDDRGKAFSSFHVNQWVRGGALGNFETITRTLNPNGAPVSLFTGPTGSTAHGWRCATRRTGDCLRVGSSTAAPMRRCDAWRAHPEWTCPPRSRNSTGRWRPTPRSRSRPLSWESFAATGMRPDSGPSVSPRRP